MSIVGKAHEEAAKEVEANGQLTGSRAKFSMERVIFLHNGIFLCIVRVLSVRDFSSRSLAREFQTAAVSGGHTGGF